MFEIEKAIEALECHRISGLEISNEMCDLIIDLLRKQLEVIE